MFPKSEPPPALRGFDILERLGAGGAGQVFLARSRAGKLVAIKVLSDVPEASRDEEFHQALAREASLCVRLNHPAIVQVRALVEEQGFAALVFEYVEGVALVRLLRFCARHGVRLPDRAAWHVVERVLAALAYAHSQRDENYQPAPIVHRDVSPANVLVDWTGGVKLADFGMAKMLGVSPATRVGVVKGTLGCMSPEQARGEAVTERADVYAAALLAWRLATGRTPFAKFKDDEIELLRAMRNPRLRPLAALRPDLPEAILTGIAASLEPDPEKRTLSADELRTRIRGNIDVESGHAELGELLARWRGALVKTLARGDESTSHSGSGSGDGHRITSEYGEAALAFDDEGVLDGPTFETYSLPSDAAILATLPIEGPLELAMPSPPSTEPASDSVRPPPPPATLESISFPIPPPARVRDLSPPAPAAAPASPESPLPVLPPRRPLRFLALALAVAVVCVLAAYLAK
ncbi:MAG TPA: serine/threonine-protein kinase [Polyangiaceae bacterium]|jgi:serine/threonine-protein kinase